MSTHRSRYSAVAMTFHWVIAALIITNVALGWTADNLPKSEGVGLIQWHKTFGVTILILSLARLGWRLTHRPPPFSAHLKAWERWLAHTVHWGFYVLMIGLPLTGWLYVSASPLIQAFPINFYGLFDWPALPFIADLPEADRTAAGKLWQEVHHLLAKVLIYGLIPLHILGALKHQFLDKDNELGRMIPFLPRPR